MNESNISLRTKGICAATLTSVAVFFWQCRPNRRKAEAGRLAGFADLTVDGKTASIYCKECFLRRGLLIYRNKCFLRGGL